MKLRPTRHLIARPVRRILVALIAATHRRRKGLVTVDEYLIAKGVDEAGRKRWSSAFGRKAAKPAREAGSELRMTWIVWRGRVRRVFAHAGTAHMDTAWAQYETKIKEG